MVEMVREDKTCNADPFQVKLMEKAGWKVKTAEDTAEAPAEADSKPEPVSTKGAQGTGNATATASSGK